MKARITQLVFISFIMFGVIFITLQTDLGANKFGEERREQTQEGDLFSLLVQDTWWNDEDQVALSLFEDRTGYLTVGTNPMQGLVFEMRDSSLLIQYESGEPFFNGKINFLSADSLEIKNEEGSFSFNR